ncbi:hypothetical protein Tco_0892014 [Tanacetum coccineum]|uniref:Uncharacterized protein n=1 Tax=Tanacetum coccineum TaxID=301880 RepID=A0ABQ5C7Q1_9ASTR
MPPVVSDVVVAAAVEDSNGYFSANVEFVHVNMSDEGYRTCPLCAEEMLLTEQQLKHCDICYEIRKQKQWTDVYMCRNSNKHRQWVILCNIWPMSRDKLACADHEPVINPIHRFLMPGLPDDRCGSAGVKLLMTLADIN